MKKIVILIISFIAFLQINCLAQNDFRFICIELQEGFYKDTVSLHLFDELIFENDVVESDLITGYSGHTIYIIKEKRNKIFNSHYQQNQQIKMLSNRLSLKVRVNQIVQSFTVNLKKGHFIGFDYNSEKHKIEMYQSKEAFEYD